MTLELMPDGVTFKKLDKTQQKALSRYYKRLHDVPLTQSLALPIGLAVLGTIGAIAYIFKNELKKEFEEQKESFFSWIFSLPKKATIATGGGVADTIVSVVDSLFTANPVTPEFITINGRQIGPLSRCKRWETDATDWLSLVQSKPNMGAIETTIAALAANRIIKNMKKEGCPRPSAFTQAQWDDI